MQKAIIFTSFLVLFYMKNWGQAKNNDFQIINKELQISWPGTVPDNHNQSQAGKGGKTPINTQPQPKHDYLQRTYIIRLKCLNPNIAVDSIYYNGYIVGNTYENPLPQGEELLYIFSLPAENGTQKPFIINTLPENIIFRYKKNGKTKYLILKDIPKRSFKNG